MKTCTKCKIEKEDSEFSKRKTGLQSKCKACNKSYRKDWYAQNKEEYIKKIIDKRKRISNNADDVCQTVPDVCQTEDNIPVVVDMHPTMRLMIENMIEGMDALFTVEDFFLKYKDMLDWEDDSTYSAHLIFDDMPATIDNIYLIKDGEPSEEISILKFNRRTACQPAS